MRIQLATILVIGMSLCAIGRADDIGTAAMLPEYRIGIDDVLDIAVWNVTELQKTMPVRPDGKISLPLVNDVVALLGRRFSGKRLKHIRIGIATPSPTAIASPLRSAGRKFISP